ncbi:Transcription initiation factor TFIID subunit 12 [Heterocephalus glaber]|uniref:Transcription initiation factor TFIID subunit 12 n=1 Tax=Heterocephalus glaber TaxID=10181 RepID=G5BMV6_HETGA|nr:Transcription initiation factor TFIID subunit 12 [Heterocephalus glaber]
MNQFGPSALINLSNFSSIKPEPASTPLRGSMANSTTVVKIPGTPGAGGLSPEKNQVLTKKLQILVREVDSNEQPDADVEEMLLQIADDFIESMVTSLPAHSASVQHPGGEGRPAAPRVPVEHVDPRIRL